MSDADHLEPAPLEGGPLESVERAVPFYCPYCGDEDLRPEVVEGVRGSWLCGSCRRVFALRFVGLEVSR